MLHLGGAPPAVKADDLHTGAFVYAVLDRFARLRDAVEAMLGTEQPLEREVGVPVNEVDRVPEPTIYDGNGSLVGEQADVSASQAVRNLRDQSLQAHLYYGR